MDLKSRQLNVDSSDAESAFTTVGLPVVSRSQSLKPTSRALIKEHFQTNEPFNFPQGHPVIAFTEDQLSSVIKIVADETVRASQDMLEGIIQQTRRLTLEATTSNMATPKSLDGRQYQRSRRLVNSATQVEPSKVIMSSPALVTFTKGQRLRQ